MADKEAIKNRIEEMERRRAFLDDYAKMDFFEFSESREHMETALRDVQICIQACVDIAKIIVAGKSSERPKDVRGLFVALEKDGIIKKDLADSLIKASGFRNILVHSYLDIDPKKAHENIKENLSDFDKFVFSVSKVI
jgi:uncharacterized protein YutE (UPF0331/DUF86 family)